MRPRAEPRFVSILGGSLFTAVTTLLASCQTRPGIGVELPLASKYVFRGAVLNEDAVLQPTLSLTVEDDVQSFTLGSFGNLEVTGETGHGGNFTEVDYSADYSRSFDALSLSVGLARYFYPHSDAAESSEAYVIAAWEGAFVTPALEYWYDFEELDGGYLNFNLSRSFELSETWSVDLVTGLGFMGAAQAGSYYGVERDGVSDALLQVTFSRPLCPSATLGLIGAFSSLVDSDYRDAVDEPDNAWGAVGISLGF